MNIFFIIILLCFCSYLENDKIVDLYNNLYYVVDVKEYGTYIPNDIIYYFRTSVEDEDMISIKINVNNTESGEFSADVCAYYIKPNDAYIIENQNLCGYKLNFLNITTSGNFDTYSYTFQTEIDVKYICIRVKIIKPMEYFSILVYSDKQLVKIIRIVLIVAIFIFCSCIICCIIFFMCLCKRREKIYSTMIDY